MRAECQKLGLGLGLGLGLVFRGLGLAWKLSGPARPMRSPTLTPNPMTPQE